MPKIQIVCTNPGMRRLGVVHPAVKTYDDGEWTAEQLDVLRADPAFVVSEVAKNGAVTRGPEFDAAVFDEVKKQLAGKADEMAKAFDTAVRNAAADKVTAAEAKTAELQKALDAANAQIVSLTPKS